MLALGHQRRAALLLAVAGVLAWWLNSRRQRPIQPTVVAVASQANSQASATARAPRPSARPQQPVVIDGFIDGYVDCDHYDYDDHDDGGVEYL